MSATSLSRCRIHGEKPCRCHAIFASVRQEATDPSSSRSEQGSTPLHPRSSPQDTSLSSGDPSTVQGTRTGSPVSGSAFSPLALCFRHSEDAEAGNTTPEPELPLAIHSSSQNRFQLLQRFYDLHLGTSSHARAIFRYETIGSGNFDRKTTTAAMDTLCVAQIATAFKDVQMMVESKRMYGRTMRRLGSKIRTIGESKAQPDQLDDIIGAIHALTAISWFQCVGVGALDWTKHAQALLKVLQVSIQ